VNVFEVEYVSYAGFTFVMEMHALFRDSCRKDASLRYTVL